MTDRNILITGTSASGKTREAKFLSCKTLGTVSSYSDYCEEKFMCLPKEQVVLIPLHEGYGYEDFVSGIEITAAKNSMQYRQVDRVFLDICRRAVSDSGKNYVIILDDIDKVNISAVFGELLYAIENRGNQIKLKDGRFISIPENLIIIATMTSVDAKNKPDYAFFRRFSNVELLSCGDCITDADAKKLYEQYNAVIEKYIAPEYKDKIRYYRLGHGMFICSDEQELLGKIHYQVVPLIEQYNADGITDIPRAELKAIRKNSETALKSAAVPLAVVKKSVDNVLRNETMLTISNALANTMARKFRGQAGMIMVHFFDLTWCSGLVEPNQLLIDLYTNTNIFKVPDYQSRLKYASFIVETANSAEYSYKTGNKADADKRSLFYPVKGNRDVEKPIYSIGGQDYVLFTGTRDEAQTVSANQMTVNTHASPHISKIIYLFVYNYYQIYLENIRRKMQTSVTTNLADLEKLASFEFNLLRNIEKTRHDIGSLYSWMRKNLKILWSAAGSNITYTNNSGQVIQLTLEGVHKMADKNYLDIMNTMKIHQMILQGPPGTSKTYGAKEFIATEGDRAGQGKNISDYQITPQDYEDSRNGQFSTQKKVLWDIVQFHPSYGYEDFVRGIEVNADENSDGVTTKGKVVEIRNHIEYSVELETPPASNIKYTSVNKILGKISKLAADAGSDTKVFLVIDEINRANVATVFGELIYALEYRGQDVATPYTVSGSNSINIPDNLYIIGTMNTADKSIGAIDYAIRRRFLFFPCLPDRSVVEKFVSTSQYRLNLFDTVNKLFENNLSEDYNKDDVQVGHTYFLAGNDDEMKLKFIYQILPILREYHKDGIIVCNDSDSADEDINILTDYLANYGKNDISEEDIWDALCSYYSGQGN